MYGRESDTSGGRRALMSSQLYIPTSAALDASDRLHGWLARVGYTTLPSLRFNSEI